MPLNARSLALFLALIMCFPVAAWSAPSAPDDPDRELAPSIMQRLRNYVDAPRRELSFPDPAVVKRGLPARWSLQLTGTSGAAFDAKSAYFLGHEFLVAVDLETGKERWRLRKTVTSSGPGVNHRLALNAGVLFLAEGESFLKAVSAKTGKVLWDEPVSSKLNVESAMKGPGVHEGDIFVGREFFGDDSNSFDLLRVNGRNGIVKWKTHINSEWNASSRTLHSGYRWMLNRAQPAFLGDAAYFPAGIGGLRAVDVFSGRPLWTFRAEDSSTPASNGFGSPVVGDRRLFVASVEGVLYALDPRTGAVIWKTLAGGAGALPETVMVSKGMVFFCDRSGMFWGLSAKDGIKVWSQRGCAPAAVGHAGNLWMGNYWSLIALDPATGARRFERMLREPGNILKFPWMRGINSLMSDGKYLYLVDFFGVTQILPESSAHPD